MAQEQGSGDQDAKDDNGDACDLDRGGDQCIAASIVAIAVLPSGSADPRLSATALQGSRSADGRVAVIVLGVLIATALFLRDGFRQPFR
jgi:hypothetical protein